MYDNITPGMFFVPEVRTYLFFSTHVYGRKLKTLYLMTGYLRYVNKTYQVYCNTVIPGTSLIRTWNSLLASVHVSYSQKAIYLPGMIQGTCDTIQPDSTYLSYLTRNWRTFPGTISGFSGKCFFFCLLRFVLWGGRRSAEISRTFMEHGT